MNERTNHESKLLSPLNSLSIKLQRLSNWFERLPHPHIEICTVLIYIFTRLLMSIYHEPWYDEAVAWQIARCASIRDILFEIPHYEGHPSLWHLILMPFAKLGAPYELSLSAVSLFFTTLSVILIINKSPFPRIIRNFLPFTYFFFYQYGVISRPYCVMMLAFTLLAINYPKRNAQPFLYVICLAFLCLTSAYGIVIAGGLSLVWLYEIGGNQHIIQVIKQIGTDKRLQYLLYLLFFALLLIIQILPRENTAAINMLASTPKNNNYVICLLYMFFALPADVCITSLYTDYDFLPYTEFPLPYFITICTIGICLWVLIIFLGRQKRTLYMLIIPFTLFSFFSSLVYFCSHHIGVGFLFFFFWFWITLDPKTKHIDHGTNISNPNISLLRHSSICLILLAMLTSLFWTTNSCILEINDTYSAGREEARFIKENNLDKYNIMVAWNVQYDDEQNFIGMDVNSYHYADNIAPYFDHNIFFNFNDGTDLYNYTTHKISTEDDITNRIAAWRNTVPDVLFMKPNLDLVYKNTLSIDDYSAVFFAENNRIWKGDSNYSYSIIYVKKDLALKLKLNTFDVIFPS